MATNSAFVFVKPHANTPAAVKMVTELMASKGVKILKTGTITAEEIDSKKLIDQHYYAIASKATILKPDKLNVPADKFKAQFGIGWQEALDAGTVFNAMDACEKLGLDAEQMDAEWGKCKTAKKLIKFGGGFYCGLIEMAGKDPIYVFNGFFMQMRTEFTKPGLSITYFVVEWPEAGMPWADFRGKLLGPTDPADAPADSARGMVLAQWKELGLAEEPNTGLNGFHASASPFEALAEINNWLETPIADIPYGQALLAAGLSEATIKDWSVDPVVAQVGGGKGSLFDSVEDLDSNACTAKLVQLDGAWKRIKFTYFYGRGLGEAMRFALGVRLGALRLWLQFGAGCRGGCHSAAPCLCLLCPPESSKSVHVACGANPWVSRWQAAGAEWQDVFVKRRPEMEALLNKRTEGVKE